MPKHPHSNEPEIGPLSEITQFLCELEDLTNLETIELLAVEIQRARIIGHQISDLRRRADGRFNLFLRVSGIAVAIVMEFDANGSLIATEGGFVR